MHKPTAVKTQRWDEQKWCKVQMGFIQGDEQKGHVTGIVTLGCSSERRTAKRKKIENDTRGRE